MTEYLTSMSSWKDVRKYAEEGDIIEFNRIKYSHYAFYIGNGICVHVIDQEEGDKGAGGLGRKCAMTLEQVANGDGCRVNNLEASRLWRSAGRHKNIPKRPISEALELATSGISSDAQGNPNLGRENGVDVRYHLLCCNCEDYAVHWRYDVALGGFSQQAKNIVGSGLGVAQRTLDAAFLDCYTVVQNEDAPVGAKVVAAAGAITTKGAAIAVGTAKAVTDGLVSFFAGESDSLHNAK